MSTHRVVQSPTCIASAFVLAVAGLSGCSDWTIPACRHSYSKRGDQQAIAELIQDFRKTLTLVQREKNVILLSEVRNFVTSRNLVAMEDWVCRAQKQYGSP